MSASHSLRSSHIDMLQKQDKWSSLAASIHFDFSGDRKQSAVYQFGNIIPPSIT